MENKIKKIEDLNIRNWMELNARSNVFGKKTPKCEQTKSKRKLNFKPNSHEKQEVSQSKQVNLVRVRSHKEFLRGKGKLDKLPGAKHEN